jgi:exopolyphosphatase/guanosine-5'-triphosphate,3'-diphosphate pyrophosphatase
MKVAALDLGSNTFLCLIARVENDMVQEIISDQVEIVRLGQEVNATKRFHPDAIVRARKCLERYRKTIDRHKPDRILAMATSAARDVSNQDELLKIGRELNIPIEIIPGDQEAEISYQGATSGIPKDKKIRAVVDVGGGSTEIIVGSEGKVLWGESVNVGAVRMTEMFPNQKNVTALQAHVLEKLKILGEKARGFKPEQVLGTAGTPTELVTAMLGGFDAKKIDGYLLTDQILNDWILKFTQTTPAERVEKFGISAGRSDVILAGTVILYTAMQVLKKQQMTVTTRGIRFGVALDLARRPG